MASPKQIEHDPEAMRAIETLRSRGYTPEQVARALEYVIDPIKASRCKKRLDCCRGDGHLGICMTM